MPPLTNFRRNKPAFWLTLVVKVALVCLLMFGAFSGLQQFEGKAFLWRLITYPVAAFVVPLAWGMIDKRGGSYPYTVDILLTLPFLIDTVGNTLDLYGTIWWWDDANHLVNWTLLSGAIGALAWRNRVRTWETLAYVVGFGTTTAVLWEIAEYVAFIRDSPEIATAYTDTLGDLSFGVAGSVLSGVAAALAPRKGSVGAKSTPSGSQFFDADQPIEHLDDDDLGRRSFAEAIAQHICSIPAEHGYTVAIVGEWGSGKTSLLNMVGDALDNDANAIVVLRFNPWLFGGASDLLTRFFGELSTQLGQNDNEAIKKVAIALTDLGQTLSPLSPIPGTYRIMKLLNWITRNAMKPQSLLKQRERLIGALKTSDSRIVVFIDDIDRLEPGETRELMRLVRLTSDLPNVVFLLAFDRRHVATSLDQSGTDGQRYIEKIVQVNYSIPTMRETILTDTLLKQLDALVRHRNLAHFDQSVWGRVFYDIVGPLLGNLRDVKRYVNSIPVTLDTVGDEVALADLLGLEAIRVLRPQIFEDLRANARYLVNPESQIPFLTSEEEKRQHIKQVLEQMLERAGEESDVLKSVLEILFPLTQGYLGGSSYTNHHGLWRRQRRVASEEVFGIYLQSTLDDGAVPSNEMQETVNSLTDETKLASLLDGLDEQQLETALERLLDYEQDFPTESVNVAVPLIANQMGRLSPHSKNNAVLRMSPRFKADIAIYRLLRTVKAPDDLASRMTEVFEKIDTLSGLQCVVEILGHRDHIGHKLVTKETSSEFESQLLEKLKSATTEELENEWNLYVLLLRTSNWLEGDTKKQFTTSLRVHLEKDEFVLKLLCTAVTPVSSNGHVEMKFHWETLVRIFGEDLADAVEKLAQSPLMGELSAEDQATVRIAQEYASGERPAVWP